MGIYCFVTLQCHIFTRPCHVHRDLHSHGPREPQRPRGTELQSDGGERTVFLCDVIHQWRIVEVVWILYTDICIYMDRSQIQSHDVSMGPSSQNRRRSADVILSPVVARPHFGPGKRLARLTSVRPLKEWERPGLCNVKSLKSLVDSG